MAGALDARANQGAGATVSFEIPAAGTDGRGAARPRPQEPAQARSAHILVVDDNATNRMVVEALCEMFDCSTESVVDGVEAVEAAKAGRYDVILMDIKMPRMDGVTAAKRNPQAAARRPAGCRSSRSPPTPTPTRWRSTSPPACARVVEKPIKPERLMEALDAALAERPPHSAAA